MEDKIGKSTQAEQKKKLFLNEESLRNVLDNMKHNNIHIMGILGGQGASKESRTYLKK